MLADLEAENHDLYRADLMKEQLREVISTGCDDGAKLLAGWIAWAVTPESRKWITSPAP